MEGWGVVWIVDGGMEDGREERRDGREGGEFLGLSSGCHVRDLRAPPVFASILARSQVYKLTSISLGGASPQAGCYEPEL